MRVGQRPSGSQILRACPATDYFWILLPNVESELIWVAVVYVWQNVTYWSEHCPAMHCSPCMTTLHVIWTVDDETVLINYLDEHQAKAGNGLSFKMLTWNEVAVRVAESTMKGGPRMELDAKINGDVYVSIVSFLQSIHFNGFWSSSRNYMKL